MKVKPTYAYSWLSHGRLLPMAEASLKELLAQGKPSRMARPVRVEIRMNPSLAHLKKIEASAK